METLTEMLKTRGRTPFVREGNPDVCFDDTEC